MTATVLYIALQCVRMPKALRDGFGHQCTQLLCKDVVTAAAWDESSSKILPELHDARVLRRMLTQQAHAKAVSVNASWWQMSDTLERLMLAQNRMLKATRPLICTPELPANRTSASPYGMSCLRPLRCAASLDHDAVVLNTFPGSGTGFVMHQYQIMTGVTPQAIYQEGSILKSWGRSPDGSWYIWYGPQPRPPTSDEEQLNSSYRYKPGSGVPSLIKSHLIGWGCTDPCVLHCCHVSRVIHIVRNPLDNAWSQFKDGKHFSGKLVAHPLARQIRQRPPPLDVYLQWLAYGPQSVHEYVRWHLSSLVRYRRRPVLLIAYEDLVLEPSKTMKSILRFQGAPFADTMHAQSQAPFRQAPHPAAAKLRGGTSWYVFTEPHFFTAEAVERMVSAYEAAIDNSSRWVDSVLSSCARTTGAIPLAKGLTKGQATYVAGDHI